MSRFEHVAMRASVHGVPEVYSAENRSWRIFWIVLIIMAIMGVTFEVYRVVSRYLNSPLITVHEIVPSNSLPFPTVEICPTHVVNASKVAQLGIHPIIIAFALSPLGDMARLAVDGFLTVPKEPYDPDIISFIVVSSPTKQIALMQLDGVFKMSGVTLPASYLEAIYAQNSSALQAQYVNFLDSLGINSTGKTYSKKYSSMNTEELLDLVGLDQDKVFLSCKFLAVDANCSEVVRPIFDQKYGRCFLVDVAKDQELNGVGLTVLLDINVDEVFQEFPGVSDGITIRINDIFNPVSFRTIMIPVGAYSSVLLRTTKYELKTARSNEICVYDMERQVTTFPYSDTVCRLECFHQLSLSRCGCTGALPKEFLKDQGNGSTPQCKSMVQMLCLRDSLNTDVMKTNKNCTNQCRPRCSYWEYTPLVSYNKFPSKALRKKLMRLGVDLKYWYENFVLLEVAFDELLYNKVSQEESATIDQLAGEIGGHLGLFLGASILSLVQIIVGCCCGGKTTAANCNCVQMSQNSTDCHAPRSITTNLDKSDKHSWPSFDKQNKENLYNDNDLSAPHNIFTVYHA